MNMKPDNNAQAADQASGDEELEAELGLPTPADAENPVHQQLKEVTQRAVAAAGGGAAVGLLSEDEEDWREY